MRQNTFKSCFSNNWDSYSKHLLKESLSPEEEKEVSRNIGHALFQLDYREILSQTGFDSSKPEKSEKAVQLVVSRLANFAEEINISDASVNFHFDATRSFHLKIGKIK